MNICIVFNSFSVVLLQQIQRVLHFTLDNESLSTENWRATKIVRAPRAHILRRDTDKLGLFSLQKGGPKALKYCLQMFEGQTKMIEQNSSWSYQLIQQGTAATNCSLGLFLLIPKFCLWLVSLSENRNLLFPFSAVLSLYTIQKNAFRTQKNPLLFSVC